MDIDGGAAGAFALKDFTCFFSDGALRPELISDNFLTSFCENIEGMDELEFNQLQEILLQLVIFEWPKNSCVVTIELLAKIYGFISSIAPEEIVEEYLTIFSKHNMPPQIKYFIYPSILRYSLLKKREIPALVDIDLIAKFTRLNWEERDDIIQDDCEFLKLFWNRLRENSTPTLGDVLLPICVNMIQVFPLLDNETINTVIQTVHQRFLEDSVTPHHILCTSVILFGLQRVSWKKNQMWNITVDICIQVIQHCSEAERNIPSVRLFGLHSVDAFRGSVEVESECMVNELTRLIENESKNVAKLKFETKLPISVTTEPTIRKTTTNSQSERPIPKTSTNIQTGRPIPKTSRNVRTKFPIPKTTATIISSEPWPLPLAQLATANIRKSAPKSTPKTTATAATENGTSDKKNPGRYLDLIEKLVERMKGQEFEFTPEDQSRLNSILKELQSYQGPC